MKEINYIALLNKRRKKTLSLEEEKQLSDWVSLSEENEQLAKEMNKIQNSYQDYQEDFTPDVDKAILKFKKRINQEKATPVRPLKTRRYFLKIAAALILAIGLGAVLNQYIFQKSEMMVYEYQSNGTNEITLPDQSVVTLNQTGKISYIKDFEGVIRKIQLEGEAFFEVTKNPERPFIVDTKNATIKVLGTSFDVKTSEDQTVVFVKTGRVSLKSKSSGKELILTPGNQGRYDNANKTLKKSYASENVISWKTKTLSFNKEPLESVIKTIENHFHIKVHYDSSLNSCKYTSLYNKLDAKVILKTLASTFKMELIQKDKTQFILKGGNCK